MKILIPVFVPPMESLGSLSRVQSLGLQFMEQGNEVVYCASGTVKEQLEGMGLTVYPRKGTTFLGLPPTLSGAVLKKAALNSPVPRPGRSRGSIYGLYVLCGLSGKRRLNMATEEILEAVDLYNPDMMITELDPGAYLAAIIRNIPLVSTYASIGKTGHGSLAWRRMKRSVNRILKKYAIKRKTEPEEILERQGVFKIIPSIPELETANPQRKDICYVGNLTGTAPIKPSFLPEKGINYIFVYLGTGSVPIRNAKKILSELMKEKNNTICYFASRMFTEEIRANNCRFVPYIPAEELLPHCILTICHGGLNTITQSLSFAVPLLIFPGALFERRFNAAKVEEAGAGLFRETVDFSVETITEAMEELAQLKTSAIILQQKLAAYHGSETAYRSILEWFDKEKINGYASF